jgi:hypothetical protein
VIGVGFQVSFLFYDTVHLYVVMELIECEHRRRSSILLDPHEGGSDSVFSFFDVSGFKAGFGCQ